MPINPELLDELLKEYRSPEDMFGTDSLLQQLTKALVERAMQAELTHHLGYEKNSSEGKNTGNSRNGSFPKTIKGKRGQVQIDVPRDRAGRFRSQIIKKGQTRTIGAILRRLRRKDHLHVLARDDHARHPVPPQRDLWG
jgi:putative transposase